MTVENILFIVRQQGYYTQYSVKFHRKIPHLARERLTSLSEQQQSLVFANVCPQDLPRHLRYVTVINSVNSGQGLSNSYYFNVLVPLFNDFDIPHVCVATTSKSSVTEHAHSFSTSGTVIIFGGDTSISEFVNGLPAPEPWSPTPQLRLMLIPTGSGNALANSIELRSPIDGIRSIFCGDYIWKPLTILPITLPGSYWPICSIVVLSLGLHAGIVGDSDTPEMRKLGNDRFIIAAQALVDNDPTYFAWVAGIPSFKHSYLLITPVKELEKGFEISPKASPPDGKTAYMIQIDKISGARFMEIMGAVYNHGKHIEFPEVTYKLVDGPLCIEVANQPELERRCCIDGAIHVIDPGVIEVGSPTTKWGGWDLLIWAINTPSKLGGQ